MDTELLLLAVHNQRLVVDVSESPAENVYLLMNLCSTSTVCVTVPSQLVVNIHSIQKLRQL